MHVAARSLEDARTVVAQTSSDGHVATAVALYLDDGHTITQLAAHLADVSLDVFVNNAAGFADWDETALTADLHACGSRPDRNGWRGSRSRGQPASQ